MERAYNFSAGPAVLPVEVLREAAEEMTNYRDSGMSVMEMSHRGAVFQNILNEAIADLRDLMNIPDNYRIMFFQGGAHLQFSMVPLNLARNGEGGYILTGQWAEKAYKEAGRFINAHVLASSKDENYSYIPDCSNPDIPDNLDYIHICENNTIYGTKFKKLPETKGKPLVADMSSCILSQPVNVEDYGLIYAGAQKNIGPAGVVIVIMREDLIPQNDLKNVPTMLQYKTQADNNSLYNTPPAYSIYICGKVFKWLKKQGGLEKMQERNLYKAGLLYDFLDSSSLFKGTVRKEDRSIMNVPFITGDKDLDAKFIKEAEKENLLNLKGHRSVGGMRASIYNAMPLEGVTRLIEFMKDFEKKN